MATIAAYRTQIRYDLSDTSGILSDNDIDRAVDRATADMSRYMPQEKVYEVTWEADVTAEAWTAAAAAGTYVTLANKPIKYDSETVTDAASATMTRDTDYTIDYANGKITHISGGDIANLEVCAITYEKAKHSINISSLTDMIRVNKVEYPVGQVPQQFVSWSIWRNVLTLEGDEAGSQSTMADKKHVAIYYEAQHTGPGDANASWPLFVDEIGKTLALFYAGSIMSYYYMAKVKTTLANIAAIQTSITGYRTSGSAVVDISSIITDAETALDAQATRCVAGAGYLTSGIAFVNTVNTGDNVPEIYGDYAATEASLAASYVREGAERVNMALANLASVAKYVDVSDAALRQIELYIGEAQQYNTLAELYLNQALQRRTEAFSLLANRGQYISDFSNVPVRQAGKQD